MKKKTRRNRKKRRLSLKHKGGNKIDFSFGIVTGGSVDERINTICESIRKEKIPIYEIIIVGDCKLTAPDIRVIPFDESVMTFTHNGIKLPPHSMKKNLIMKEAKHENVVLMHDYVALKEGWYNGFLKFGNNFEVCMCPVVNIFEGEKASNYWLNTIEHPIITSMASRKIPADFKVTPLLSKLTYPEGKFQIYKKTTGLKFPLYEHGWDDTLQGFKLADANIMIHTNTDSELTFLKSHGHVPPGTQYSNESLQKLYNLSESEINDIHEAHRKQYKDHPHVAVVASK